MSFAAVERALRILPALVVGLASLSCAQDDSLTAQSRGPNSTVCGEDEFQCRNHECIQSQFICDGQFHCLDSSDERENLCSRPDFACPSHAFRCAYGACIAGDSFCDEIVDCILDASDEDLTVCGKKILPPYAAYYPQKDHEVGMPFSGGSSGGGSGVAPLRQTCSLPPRPINGQYKLPIPSADGDIKYMELMSSGLKPYEALVYSCDPGYKLRGDSNVICNRNLRLSRKPVCIEIQCGPMSSLSMVGNCTDVNGTVAPCDDAVPVRPKTRAEVACRPRYRVDTESPFAGSARNVECNERGKWVPEPIKCVPVCGVSNQPSVDQSETPVNIATLPWYAKLYVVRNSSKENDTVFRCSATVIRANLLLTAAHCLYDFNASSEYIYNSSINASGGLENFLVATGDYDPSSQDTDRTKMHKAKNVHTPCRFYNQSGFFAMDIALIELQDPLEFSATLGPVCLNEVEVDQRAPQFEQSSCAVDAAHDGGGLAGTMNGVWYVFGIINQREKSHTDSWRLACTGRFAFLYTAVDNHMRWIRQVIDDLEHSKYPPCSRYLPPFHRKIIPPTSTLSSTQIENLESKLSSTSMTLALVTSTTPTTPVSSVDQIIIRLSQDQTCPVPPQPENGIWRLHKDFCLGDGDCRPSESSLSFGSQLVYSCHFGYRANGSTDVYCRADGRWSAIPVCTEITCRPLNTVSEIAACTSFGKRVKCDQPLLTNTVAKVSCRAGYSTSSTASDTVECNANGEWEPEPFSCEPACGVAFRHPTLFSTGQIFPTNSLPWQAGLYVERYSRQGVTKELLCGATLIRDNLLLTAAHCLTNDVGDIISNPDELFVLVNNIYRQYDTPLHTPHFVRRDAVKNIHVHCEYRGPSRKYLADIALLELHDPVVFSSTLLQPACLDFSGYHMNKIGPGVHGTIVGYGKTATGLPSDVLESIAIPCVTHAECKNSVSKAQSLVNYDKFCAGYKNGTAVCLGNGGGGLFLLINNLWHIVGIASVDLGDHGDDGEETTCDGSSYTLYTDISHYMSWILDVMYHLERGQSYPPCG